MKVAIMLLSLIVVVIAYRLTLFSQGYTNEVLSILLFDVDILRVSTKGENEILIRVNLSNPSPKDVNIASIIYDFYYEDDLVSQRYIDLSAEPLVIKKQSNLNDETSVRIGKIQLHEGMRIHVNVRVTVVTAIFGLTARRTEADYIVDY